MTYPPSGTLPIVWRRTRRLLWLSSYWSVSSIISSDIISCQKRKRCEIVLINPTGKKEIYFNDICDNNKVIIMTKVNSLIKVEGYLLPSSVITPIAPPGNPGVRLISKRWALPVWLYIEEMGIRQKGKSFENNSKTEHVQIIQCLEAIYRRWGFR